MSYKKEHETREELCLLATTLEVLAIDEVTAIGNCHIHKIKHRLRYLDVYYCYIGNKFFKLIHNSNNETINYHTGNVGFDQISPTESIRIINELIEIHEKKAI